MQDNAMRLTNAVTFLKLLLCPITHSSFLIRFVSRAALSFGFCWGSPIWANVDYDFSNAGATGRLGPTQTQVNSAYAGSNLAGNVTINAQGIQEWTVPLTGEYRIEAKGAKGGGGTAAGLGAQIAGSFSLTQGSLLKIVVGQAGGLAGNNNTTSGGGGSFVIKSPYNSNSSILIIAGGGGGSPGNSDFQSGGHDDGQTGNSGSRGSGKPSHTWKPILQLRICLITKPRWKT